MPHTQVRLSERLFAAVQTCLPTRLLSTVVHHVANSRVGWLKRLLIAAFCRLYAIDLRDAAEPERDHYPSFNALFTRALRPDARPLDGSESTIVSPVDGRLGAFGDIDAGHLFQAKGMTYELADLLAQQAEWARLFAGGRFATLYLAPHNYHRVHLPLAAELRGAVYVPGRLFGVNPASVRTLPRLFTRNERLNCLFDTAVGPMALIMVGAFCVGGMETTWQGRVSPPHRRGAAQPLELPDGSQAPAFTRGEEMGRFNLGSTVILLFGSDAIDWHGGLATGQSIRLGQALARAAVI